MCVLAFSEASTELLPGASSSSPPLLFRGMPGLPWRVNTGRVWALHLLPSGISLL